MEEQRRDCTEEGRGILTSVQGRVQGELLAHGEVVSWVNDVVDTITLGNQVHLEEGLEEMTVSGASKNLSLAHGVL